MVAATFTFGSFGDIIALLQLLRELRHNLCDAAAASEDIKSLIADIDAFSNALESARSTIERAQHVPQSVRNSVAQSMHTCFRVLQQIQGRIQKHRLEVVQAHGQRVWSGFWAACAWTVLGGKADIKALKRRLAEQVLTLQTLLSVLQSSTLHDIARRAQEDRITMTRMIDMMDRFPLQPKHEVPFRFFERDGRGVPPLVKLPYEGYRVLLDALSKVLRFEIAAHEPGRLHTQWMGVGRLGAGRLFTGYCPAWDYYIYDDSQLLGERSVLMSPLYFTEPAHCKTPQRLTADESNFSRVLIDCHSVLRFTSDLDIDTSTPAHQRLPRP